MYWFSRPPYLRWVGATMIVLAAAWMDLRPPSTIAYPFATANIPPGTTIEEGTIEWRQVPTGLLPPSPEPGGVALNGVAAGEPILPSLVSSDRPPIPDGWWGLATELPDGVTPGQSVKIVIVGTPPLAVPGIVIEAPPKSDPLGYDDPVGLVAVPADFATAVAAGSARGDLGVLLGPRS